MLPITGVGKCKIHYYQIEQVNIPFLLVMNMHEDGCILINWAITYMWLCVFEAMSLDTNASPKMTNSSSFGLMQPSI